MIDRRQFLSRAGTLALIAAAPGWACATAESSSSPIEVLLIRHGEEPERGESVDLNDRGRQRADALIRLFPARFQPPGFLFAAKSTKHTNRPVETIEPLSKALHLPINQDYDEQDYAALAQALLHRSTFAGARILVCWHQSSLPKLAEALGVPSAPNWRDKQYDRIWQIHFGNGHATLADLPQALLPGDSR